MRANLRYGKNQQREDVKSHHYILSFDPRDGPDHGLTMDKAQALGERFCAEQFPGHQALVCTHPDGHNHSGNIHVHIVINSLRVAEVERKPYMDRASDTTSEQPISKWWRQALEQHGCHRCFVGKRNTKVALQRLFQPCPILLGHTLIESQFFNDNLFFFRAHILGQIHRGNIAGTKSIMAKEKKEISSMTIAT